MQSPGIRGIFRHRTAASALDSVICRRSMCRFALHIRPRRTNAAESVVLMVRYRIDFRVNGCTLIASRIGAARLCPKFTANYGAEAVATGIEYVRLERVLHAG